MRSTSIGWPLRFWFFVELFFAVSATLTVAVRPAETATSFAWTIQPAVMAAVFGAFYVALAPVVILALAAKRWESVRVFVLPGMLFTLHPAGRDLPALGSLRARHLGFQHLVRELPAAAAGLPRLLPLAAATGRPDHAGDALAASDPASRSSPSVALFTLEALIGLVYPAWFSSWAPWKITPLNARALGGYFLLLGTMMLSMARENDRDRVRILSPFLILLLPVAAFQLRRFSDQVDWSHPRVAIGLTLLVAVAALGAQLFRGSWRRALGR